MSWIEEQRESLARKPSGPSPLLGILTWVFMLGCAGLAIVGAYSVINPHFSWQFNLLSNVARNDTKPEKLRDFNEVARKIDAAHAEHMKSASAPAKPGARVGIRSRATFLSLCQSSLGNIGGIAEAVSGKRVRLLDKPEDFERLFAQLDAVVSMSSAIKIAEVVHADAIKNKKHMAGMGEIASVGVVADFLSCALARPEAVMCKPDNRAAVLSYLETYFANYQKATEVARKLPPKERVAVERLFPAFKHENIERDLDRHAKAGGIRSSDVGWFADTRLKAILARYDGAPDTCSKP